MVENTNTQQTSEQNQAPQQYEPVQKKVLMPGQAHEDEIDLMGAALFGLIGKGFGWIKNRFSPRKVQ